METQITAHMFHGWVTDDLETKKRDGLYQFHELVTRFLHGTLFEGGSISVLIILTNRHWFIRLDSTWEDQKHTVYLL